jgi:hypothetical protein
MDQGLGRMVATFAPRDSVRDHPETAKAQVSGGGDEGTRTLNPCLAKAVLCQLSYVPETDSRFQPALGGGLDVVCCLGPQIGIVVLCAGHPVEHDLGDRARNDGGEQLLQHGAPSGEGWLQWA